MNGHMPNSQHITARHLTAIIAALLLLVMEGCTSSRFGEGGHTFRQDNPEIDRRFQIADLGASNSKPPLATDCRNPSDGAAEYGCEPGD